MARLCIILTVTWLIVLGITHLPLPPPDAIGSLFMLDAPGHMTFSAMKVTNFSHKMLYIAQGYNSTLRSTFYETNGSALELIICKMYFENHALWLYFLVTQPCHQNLYSTPILGTLWPICKTPLMRKVSVINMEWTRRWMELGVNDKCICLTELC